jgi:FkbM family methyltransferase
MNISLVSNYFLPHRILDIGANVGQFYRLCKTTYPEAYVFSIEASPECEAELSKLTDQYYIGLLAKDSEPYEFYTRKNDPTSTGNSVYKELTSFFDEEHLEVRNYQGVMLDSLFTDTSEFDLIKLDTQGSELDILRGGKNLVSLAKGILLEVSLVPYNENAPLQSEVEKYMDSIGFYPAVVLGDSRHPITHNIIQHDVLYLRTNSN